MLKNIKQRLKDQRGLTLIELLAVIVILGIIAAIAIPSIGGIINKTKNDAKVAEGIQIISAAKMYVASHNVPDGGLTIENTAEKSVLEGYLDNVEDKTFKVVVTKNTSTGKFSYEIENHESGKVVAGTPESETEIKVSEEQLLAY